MIRLAPSVILPLAAVAMTAIVASAGTWAVQSWRLGGKIATLKAQHAQVLQDIAGKTAKAHEAVLRYQATVNARLADRDAEHYQELTHAQNETRHLRACVAAGTCGVRILTAATPGASACPGPQDASTSRVGDGALALDGETAERVLDLRESVQSDAAKLAYLRDYAQACWRAGVEGAGVGD